MKDSEGERCANDYQWHAVRCIFIGLATAFLFIDAVIWYMYFMLR